ncbi:MAG TPA: AtpZ/AtpI family protein [Candidatus Acidoferrales bacterium]
MAPEDRGPRKGSRDSARAFALAWSLPFSLVVPMVLGGGIGFLLDRWLHTRPIFMLVLGILGLGIGVREVVKTAALLDKKDGG